MTNNRITVVTASIPIRYALLTRAVHSAATQTQKPHALSIAIDTAREGAPATRQRALMAVNPKETPWVAILDDDDEFMPHHLDHLLQFAKDGDYDFVYSWFKIVVGRKIYDYDPVFPKTHFTEPWDPANPRHTTVTTLVKTELAQTVGYNTPDVRDATARARNTDEDWRFVLECNRLGKIGHLVEHTWYWHHDSENTSGLPSRW